MQRPTSELEAISEEQLDTTFKTNVYSMFYLTQLASPHMPKGSSIINTSSVVSFKGHPALLDYSSTKGAITTYTRSLAQQFASRGIRVNCVAPGPIWTPLIVATFDKDTQKKFGTDTYVGQLREEKKNKPSCVVTY